MKTKKLFTLLALAGIIVFASCKKDNSTPDPLSKTEAETAFTSAESDFAGLTETLDTQTGIEVLNGFEDIGLPGLAKKSEYQNSEALTKEELEKIPSFAKQGGGYVYDQEPYIWFNYNDLKGKTYTYSFETGWSSEANGTENIVIIMPYGEGTATLTYSGYETGLVNGEPYITHLKAEYKISTQTTPVMSWVYSANRTLTTQNYRFVFTIGEYTKTKTYSNDGYISKSTDTKATLSWSVVWEKNNSVILSRSYTRERTYNTDQSYTTVIYGNYRVRDVVIKWNIMYNSISTDFSNPNNYIKIAVWTVDGAKVADIIFKMPPAKYEYMLYIVFNDGTEVALNNYIDYLYEILYSYTWYISGLD